MYVHTIYTLITLKFILANLRELPFKSTHLYNETNRKITKNLIVLVKLYCKCFFYYKHVHEFTIYMFSISKSTDKTLMLILA